MAMLGCGPRNARIIDMDLGQRRLGLVQNLFCACHGQCWRLL